MEQPPQPKTRKKAVLNATMRLQLRSMQKKAKNRKEGSLDWEAAHKRLAALGQADFLKNDPVAILQERTLEIARPVQNIINGRTDTPLVVLHCGQLQLALEVEYVREIIRLENLTEVPGTPDFVAGVVNARGKILTLINLELFLNQKARKSQESQQKGNIIVVETGNFQFGLICDDSPEIAQHDPTAFKPITSLRLDYNITHLTGINPEGILLLNLLSLVTDPDFLVNQE